MNCFKKNALQKIFSLQYKYCYQFNHLFHLHLLRVLNATYFLLFSINVGIKIYYMIYENNFHLYLNIS
jgi:hypothetical protein